MQENPKGAGSISRARYECYKGTATIAAGLSAGCRQDDLRWDLKHGFLTLHDPALDSRTAAPGPLASDAVVSFMKNGAMRGLFFCQKKGDLSLCRNWRGICLQTGFRPDRGTIDGLLLRLSDFTNARNMGLKRGHSLLTW